MIKDYKTIILSDMWFSCEVEIIEENNDYIILKERTKAKHKIGEIYKIKIKSIKNKIINDNIIILQI